MRPILALSTLLQLLAPLASVCLDTKQEVDRELLFAKFKVNPSVGRLPSRERIVIDRRSPTETLAQFRVRVRSAAAQRANFAGGFTIVVWSCGFACQDGAVVDVRSGQLRWLPFSISDCADSGELLAFRPDSRLLITGGRLEWSTGQVDQGCPMRFFEWTGSAFKRVHPVGSR